MSIVRYLGTCSGTEPFPNMHHVSWILECGGVNYWFDAGENCFHRAFTDGVDVMKTVALFVSHPHIDHIGGLANLFAFIHKMARRYKQQFIRDNTLQLYFPDLPILQAVKTVAYGKPDPTPPYTLAEHQISDGNLFEDENIRVTALHNRHMKEDGSNGWHSYSFCIEAENKKIVYSGDVKEAAELLPLIGDGCDLLIMESGHHDVQSIFDFALAHNVQKLRMNHHGRQILENRAYYEELAAQYTREQPIDIRICYDGITEEI